MTAAQAPQDPLFDGMRKALSNAARNADTSHADVVVGGAGLTLRVVDYGRGFMPREGSRELRNIEERARPLGGRFTVTPDCDGGTVLEWRVPLGR